MKKGYKYKLKAFPEFPFLTTDQEVAAKSAAIQADHDYQGVMEQISEMTRATLKHPDKKATLEIEIEKNLINTPLSVTYEPEGLMFIEEWVRRNFFSSGIYNLYSYCKIGQHHVTNLIYSTYEGPKA